MVGLCDGMLLLFAQRAQQDGRWQDCIPEETLQEIQPFDTFGGVHPNYRKKTSQEYVSLVRRR